MLKKMTTLLVCGVFTSSLVYATNGFYIGGHVGVAGVTNSDTDVFSSYQVNGKIVEFSPVGSSAGFGNNTDYGFAGGVSAGYDFKEQYGTPVRLELNYTARSEASSTKGREHRPGSGTYMNLSQKTDLQTLMFNMWVDLPLDTKIKPYVGGGVGVAFIDYSTSREDQYGNTTEKINSGSVDKTNFAYTLGAGLAYDVTPNFTLDLGYRYVDAGKVKLTNAQREERWHLNENPLINWRTNQQTMRTKIQSNELFLGGRLKF